MKASSVWPSVLALLVLAGMLCSCSAKDGGGTSAPGGESSGQSKGSQGKAITCMFYSDVWADYLYEVNDAF
ncbi:MAG: hypothetical protein DBX66_00895, partial [Clostridiales bacterium]